MTPSCCERFRPYWSDPSGFCSNQPRTDLDQASVSTDGVRRVTVTMRGLFLTRDLCVQHDSEDSYDPETRQHRPRPWHHDTCIGGLGLDMATIATWRAGARVLDVAAGLSVLGCELAALGVTVDAVDRELVPPHPSFELARANLSSYETQLHFLRCLAKHAGSARHALTEGELELLEDLLERAATLADRYPSVSGERRADDATTLATCPTDAYDAALCGWLMVHLEPDEERRAIENLVRVTKTGGRVFIRAGYGGKAAKRLLEWFPALTIAEKAVAIEPKPGDDLLVLSVRAA